MTSITQKEYGTAPDGTAVYSFTLTNTNGMCAEILSYGCAVRRLVVPGGTGIPLDVVLGFDALEDYVRQDKYLGSVAGRVCNRIENGCFQLDGKIYRLFCNDGKNHLHGGREGFDKKAFIPAVQGEKLMLTYTSPDGEEGYPGSLTVTVVYSISEKNALRIEYRMCSDKDTLCSLTNHSYFNLNGHASGSILQHTVKINADYYTPANAFSIPGGGLAAVEGTPLDLRVPAVVGERIKKPFPQLLQANGFDCNYAVNGGETVFREAGCVQSTQSGVTLSVWSDLPGVQFYTGNFLKGAPRGKEGVLYQNHGGLCLETQYFPNAVNTPGFLSPLLKAGQKKTSVTEFRFGNI